MSNRTTPILIILLIFASFAVGAMYMKIQYLEAKNNQPAITNSNQPTISPPSESPLSVDNLKKYAREMGMDSAKFDGCLDAHETAEEVKKQQEYGQSVGVNGTPGFFVNGIAVSGAQAYSVFKEIIDGELLGGITELNASESLKQMVKSGAVNLSRAKIAPIGDTFKGSDSAPVVLVEFSDFECPFCERVFPTVQKILEDYSGKVKFYYQNYPLPPDLHPNAQNAAEASLCAGKQGKFWEYHDRLFKR